MENKFTQELFEKAKQAKSAEELLALAKENSLELTEDEAKEHFEQLNESGELSDEELENVSGGGCYYKDGRLIVTVDNYCSDSFWRCKRCHGRPYFRQGRRGAHTCYDYAKGFDHLNCNNCQFMVYEHGLWLCDNPGIKKR